MNVLNKGKGVRSLEIFEEEGEDYFRMREREVLHELCNEEDEFVLATGGGTPVFSTIWLHESRGDNRLFEYFPACYRGTIKTATRDRPLLAMYTDGELEHFCP